MAIRSCKLLGAERVIAIDDVPERLEMAEAGGAELIDLSEGTAYERLMEITGGRGPDACIDAVGMEAHGFTPDALYDRIKTATFTSGVRMHALREAIWSCRKGGTVSVAGVYGGPGDKVPLGAAFQKGLTFRGGQTHVQHYMPILLDLIAHGKIDPSFVITHRLSLDDAPWAYRTFQKKEDRCIKVVMDPWAQGPLHNGNGGGNGHARGGRAS
jgi:threonine dehydrogenase-like Zn-dependent dehydrogenase